MKEIERRAPSQPPPAFEALYRAEYPKIVRLAYALTGRLGVAEELAQEAFLACHQHWGRVASFDQPEAWVRRVVVNRCVSSGRRHLTELKLLARLNRERAPNQPSEEIDEHLWALVRSLPRRQAQVAALRFAEDLSVQEIAMTLDIGEESVRTHLRRARTELSRRLEEAGADG